MYSRNDTVFYTNADSWWCLIQTPMGSCVGKLTVLSRVVIVGASLAGLRAAQTLRREGYDGSLTIVGAEDHHPYNRPPLSKDVLAGATEPEKVDLGAAKVEADWLLGRPATALDLDRREVVVGGAERVSFDGLVIATGSTTRAIRSADHLDGVFTLRTLDDCLALKTRLDEGPGRVAVVGAGFIGCEVASTCRARGLDVSLIDVLPQPMAPLGPELGRYWAGVQRDAGVDVRLGNAVVAFEGTDRLECLVLADGTRLEADVAVVGVGVRPATDWLVGSGLTLDDGVVCDASCAALGCDNVVAAGDVARWPSSILGGQLVRVEHWSNASEQGAAAARSLLAGPDAATPYNPLPSFWSEQFGARIQALGMPHLADSAEIIDGSLGDGRFAMLFGASQRVIGAVAFNAAPKLAKARTAIAEGADFDQTVAALREA